MRILAIDPGNQQSAYALLDADLRPVKFAKKPNDEVMKDCITILEENTAVVVIEMIASYGMAVGKEVFDTCLWIGRFIERLAPETYKLIYRREEKENLCGLCAMRHLCRRSKAE